MRARTHEAWSRFRSFVPCASTRIIGIFVSITGGTFKVIKEWAPVLAYFSLIISAASFLQRQEPLIDTHLNHETKAISITNSGWFFPIGVSARAFLFELNLNPNLRPSIINYDNPINSISTRGILFEDHNIWPLQKYVIELSNFSLLEFQQMGPIPNKNLYCIAIRVHNLLSNQSSFRVLLTPGGRFPASNFGLLPKNGALGGGYESYKAIEGLEDQIRKECLNLNSKFE